MKVINLFGEAGVGKSVTASGLHYFLSLMNYNVEIAPEFVKGYAWESEFDATQQKHIPHPLLSQQVFIFGAQNRSLERLRGKVDFAIAECPLLLGAIYAPDNYYPNFTKISLDVFNTYDNINILLTRTHPYSGFGRFQDESEAKEVREKMIRFLNENKVPFITLQSSETMVADIIEIIKQQDSN